MPWTDAEIKILLAAIYEGKKSTEVDLPGRSASSIAAKMSRLRGKSKQKGWSHEEREILKENYNKLKMSELLELLPERTAGSVRGQVSFLRARGWPI